MKVKEGVDDDEYIITRLDNTMPALNIINIYSEQEGRSTKDEIEQSWLRLLSDLREIEDRGEAVLIIGDLNRAIGNDQWGIQGNKVKVSHYINNLPFCLFAFIAPF